MEKALNFYNKIYLEKETIFTNLITLYCFNCSMLIVHNLLYLKLYHRYVCLGKNTVYRWFNSYPLFQASTGDFGTFPADMAYY